MNSRERLQAAASHTQPDKAPVDFGSAPVTSIHCSWVADLRQYDGQENGPVKVHEPFQMLGWLDEDLIEVLGIDTVGISPRDVLFGVPNGGWKKFRTPWGQEVLISGHLDISQGEHGDFFVYAQGDRSAPPSGHMPESGYYFDLTTRHVRDLERDTLDPADNLEEFAEVSQEDLDHFEKEVAKALATGRGTVANLGTILLLT